jgi:hypothetical protein
MVDTNINSTKTKTDKRRRFDRLVLVDNLFGDGLIMMIIAVSCEGSRRSVMVVDGKYSNQKAGGCSKKKKL